MVEFKAKADAIIKERWGIEVEHVCAMKDGEKLTYEKIFYRVPKRKNGGKFSDESVNGFPLRKGAWCNDRLKTNTLDAIARGGGDIWIPHRQRTVVQFDAQDRGLTDGPQNGASIAQGSSNAILSRGDGFSESPQTRGGKNIVQYIGIAADEPNRFHNLTDRKRSPLVEAGWTESVCREWCEKNDLLSPIYTTATRGGCWFCHNQGVDQLRLLRRNYPEYWALMLKWDKDSLVSFKPDGHTVHDFDARFALEDEGVISPDDKWKWAYLCDEPIQMKIR